MLGSAVDAEDAVQEAMLRAWRSLEGFDGRSSLRTWLYRIATNVCLDARSDRARRERPTEGSAAGTLSDALEARPRTHWLEPIAEARALPTDVDPSERLVLRQSLRLAFVAALQHLPGKQRAALLLTEVLGWSATEVADCLDTSVPAVNSALQRARATLATRDLGETAASSLSDTQVQLVERYLSAFEQYDMDGLTALLREDATLSMPPYTLWLQGQDNIRGWLLGRGSVCRGSRLVPVSASGAPAFAHYHPKADGSGHAAWGLMVLEVSGDKISQIISFLDAPTLFPHFGLPLELPA